MHLRYAKETTAAPSIKPTNIAVTAAPESVGTKKMMIVDNTEATMSAKPANTLDRYQTSVRDNVVAVRKP